MRDKTHIEWTQSTWNPVTGCSKVSAGCTNCYAERMAKRLKAMGNPRYSRGFKVSLHHDLLDVPKHWRTPRRIFVNSMSDLFHEDVPLDFVKKIFQTMKDCPQHTFQILTKRSSRLCEWANKLEWTHNIWMGVTVEDNDAVKRIDDLRKVPAEVRFLSCEPLIGALPDLDLTGIHWVIVGGESGPHSRPIDAKWVLDIRRVCKKSKVPFFFKQWGGTRKDITGRELEGRIYSEMPELKIREVSVRSRNYLK